MPSARTYFFAVLALITVSPSLAQAQSSYDNLWDQFTLYDGSEGAGLVKNFALSGRLQADAIFADADEGEFDDLLWRRFRFGFKSKLANDWVVQLEGDFDLQESVGDWYSRLTDAYVGWNPGEELDLRFFKHSAGFTLDGATSSKKLLTTERNNLTNNLWFTAEYFSGVSAKGELENGLTYQAGVFSGDPDDEVGFQDGSYFTLTSLGWSFSPMLELKTAKVRFDYVYQDEDPLNNTRNFSTVTNLVSQWENGHWGLWTDLSAGNGWGEQSDIWGLVLMPFYSSSEKLQWVARYTYLDSKNANGLRLGRYEREIVGDKGDQYSEFYLGANYFFYGQKLKWQNGLQYGKMKDTVGDGGRYEGWAFTSGIRIYWY